MKKYITETDNIFQVIYKTDPMARYYNLKRGDMIKIIRPCPTSGVSIAYRITK